MARISFFYRKSTNIYNVNKIKMQMSKKCTGEKWELDELIFLPDYVVFNSEFFDIKVEYETISILFLQCKLKNIVYTNYDFSYTTMDFTYNRSYYSLNK